MPTPLTQDDLLAAIFHDVLRRPDAPVTQTAMGDCLCAIQADRVGLASLPLPEDRSDIYPKFDTLPAIGESAQGLAGRLLAPDSQGTLTASLALAAANSLLPPPPVCSPLFGQDVLASRGKNKNVAVIGHFPFVDAASHAFAKFWVLELQPLPGDYDASLSDVILPQVDLLAVTATTLLNGTLAGILNLCRPDALVILLGPTTPFAPSLFDCGIDILAGCDCLAPQAALTGVAQNHRFRELEGARQLAWEAATTSGCHEK